MTTAGAPTLRALRVKGGAFELAGTSQMVGTLDSNSLTTGRIIRNTAGGGPVTLATVTGAAASFGGSIDGNLNLVKIGNFELVLTNPNTYTTTIRGNTLRQSRAHRGHFDDQSAGRGPAGWRSPPMAMTAPCRL